MSLGFLDGSSSEDGLCLSLGPHRDPGFQKRVVVPMMQAGSPPPRAVAYPLPRPYRGGPPGTVMLRQELTSIPSAPVSGGGRGKTRPKKTKSMLAPGLEPGIFRVLGGRVNQLRHANDSLVIPVPTVTPNGHESVD